MRALLATQFSIVPHGGRYYTKSAFAAILRRYGAAFGPLTLCVPVKQTWSPCWRTLRRPFPRWCPFPGTTASCAGSGER